MGIGLYVHIPICRYKCYYCDFNSYPLSRYSESDLDLYVLAIEYELKQLSRLSKTHELTSVYFGGGTPPLLDTSRLVLIMEAIAKYFNFASECEKTVELNPLDCTPDVLRGLQKAGFNRYSLGVQSFDDATLTKLGRAHSADEAHQAIQMLRETINNLSLDLIYGVLDDSEPRWHNDLETALSYEPEHLSLYSLQVEADTVLARLIDQGFAKGINNDIQADHWEYACDRLYPTDYVHYEISNWAKPGRESQHNLGYWLHQPYFGVGAGAAGFFGGYRYRNLADPWEYTASIRRGDSDSQFPAADFSEELTKEQLVFERIILALRTKQGLNMEAIAGMSAAEFWRRYGQKINGYQQMGLIWRNGQTIGLTEPGMSLSNRIFLTFAP